MTASLLAGEHLVIAGWCEQGRSAVRAFGQLAGTVTIVNDIRPSDLPDGVAFAALGDSGDDAMRTADVILRCPPLHPRRIDHVLAVLPEQRRPRRTSATAELLAARDPRRVIGITGTKGKSSTAALVAHVLADVSSSTLAGNCGVSPLDVLGAPSEWMVLELANFQTIDLNHGPGNVILRPVTSDHLDWHGSLAAYVEAKRRLVRVMPPDGLLVFDTEDPCSRSMASVTSARRADAKSRVDSNGVLEVAGRPLVRLDPRACPGAHAAGNVAAAVDLLVALGIDSEQIAAALATFRGLPHRLELLGTFDEVRYVNDSHSTAVASCVAALAAEPNPTVLLLGGDTKAADLGPLVEAVRASRVRACVTFGDDGVPLRDALTRAAVRVVHVDDSGDMVGAVTAARLEARPGDTILLSPGGASGRGYADAAARGDAFRRAVRALDA